MTTNHYAAMEYRAARLPGRTASLFFTLLGSHLVVAAAAWSSRYVVQRLERRQERHWRRLLADAVASHTFCLDPIALDARATHGLPPRVQTP